MIKPCDPGATVTDRPLPRPSRPSGPRPAHFEAELTLDEDAPKGANPDGAGPAPTFLKLAPVDRLAAKPSRPERRPLAKQDAAPAPLTPRERNRVAIATAGIIGLAVVLVWAMPTRPAAVARVERPAVLAETPKPKVRPAEPSPSVPQVGDEPLWLQVPLGDGTTERRAGGMVKVWSDPPADVSIVNGEKFGRTPAQVTAPVGPVRLAFDNREVGLHKVVTLEIRPGLNGPRTLEFGRGWLEISAAPGSKVSIDGRAIGATPVPLQTLFEGTHTIEVLRVDRQRDTRQLEIAAGMTVTHEVALPLLP